jgi:hypothetical protein
MLQKCKITTSKIALGNMTKNRRSPPTTACDILKKPINTVCYSADGKADRQHRSILHTMGEGGEKINFIRKNYIQYFIF